MLKKFSFAAVLTYSLLFTLAVLMLSGCNFLRPTRELPAANQSQPFKAPELQPTATSQVTVDTLSTSQAAQVPNCTNDLVFLEDLTIPDGTQVDPGSVLEKKWQVKNSGTCNWNEEYTIRLVSGSDLGASSPQVLVPARNGAEAVILLSITAPSEPGRYEATWRAFGPDEQPFGEWFSVAIVVIGQ